MENSTLSTAESDRPAAAGAADVSVGEIKGKTTRGALVSMVAQITSFVVRIGSMMFLARLLLKEDFGLVNMVTAFTGFLGLFRDAGLSMATIQRASITEAQTSTLFWVNLAVGVLLAALALIAAPILAAFYGEPRLFWVTAALGSSFIFNGAAAQHRALLQRRMKFLSLAIIDTVALVCSTGAGIAMAVAGYGYWALVAMTVGQPLASAFATWWATRWVPGKPRRGSGVRSMLWYGGTVTVNNVVVYIAYNVDKVLLGKFWGAEVLGVYGRAYQLVNLPTENLNSTIGMVGFPALSRLQDDPARLRSYFLKGYSLFLALVMPITISCALFAEDIIRVFLGAKWHEAAGIFRLMAPTILVFALVNPLAWMMLASGHAMRSLKIAFLIAPVVILSYALGLNQGAHGVAAGFSIAMVCLAVPVMLWAKRGTLITNLDLWRVVSTPLLSVLGAAGVTWAARGVLQGVSPVFLRLVLESALLFGSHFLILLFVMRQKAVYAGLLRDTGLWRRPRKN